MKTLLTFLMMIALSLNAQVASNQVIVKQGKDYVYSGGPSAGVAKPYGANLIVGGTPYPIWISANGKYYILRTSKKTAKEYKQYISLPQ